MRLSLSDKYQPPFTLFVSAIIDTYSIHEFQPNSLKIQFSGVV
jgi:hypothetical protein